MSEKSRSLNDRKELHKAWLITVKGFSEIMLGYGPSAGKVRYCVYQDLVEAWGTSKFSEISVKRHKQRDEIRTLQPGQTLAVGYGAL